MDYASLAQTSLKLLTEHGRTVTFRTKGKGTYVPGTSAVTLAPAVDAQRKAAEFPLGAGEMFQGNLVEQNDTKLLLEPTGGEPSLEDQVVIGSKTKSIVSCAKLAPAGVPVLYTLHLRA